MKLNNLILRFFTLSVITAGAAWGQPREVRIGSHVSQFSPLHAQSVLFAEEIEKHLPGQFEFKLFPSGQLGGEKELMTSVQAGSIEMINVASSVLKLDGRLGVFDLPWLFEDREHVKRAMNSGLENAVRRRIENVSNVKVIGIYENGFRHIINTKRPIEEPFDLEGLKIRISGGKFRQSVFLLLGAAPQSIPWGETFTALQSGVVDGASAATYGFYEQKHFEVARYLSLTSHVYTPSFLLASKAFFESLTPEQQRIFDKAGKEIRTRAYEEAAKLEAKYFDEMKNKTRLKINSVDIAEFSKLTRSSYKNYRNKYGNAYLSLVHKTAQ